MTPTDAQIRAILTLNNAHPDEVSVLDEAALRALLSQAFHLAVVGNVDAFLLALDQTADYASPNYAWVRARYPRFAYVDRLIVAPHVRGQGLARRMYEGLFQAASAAGHPVVLCEVHQEPPNPVSDALHASLGFQPVGLATVYGGTRTVQYLARPLP